MEGALTGLFFSWWYGEAYNRLFKYLNATFLYLYDMFSVRLCLKTLFAVWKRDQIGYEGLSIQEKFQVFTLNIASRFIGFIIKFFTLLSFAVAVMVASVISLVLVVIWPFYPLILVYLLYIGIKNIL